MDKKRRYKILLVEDEPGFQKALRQVLEQKEGYEVIQAFDGEEGIKLAQEKKPDLILLDLILPKKNGFEVLRFLNGRPELAVIPVVVLTNLESGNDIERAISSGAKAYLIKADYSLDEITRRIAKLVEEYIVD
ncbi:MAG: response regulator [Candidatus Niyogibacteria bacterium]|nr:response regulator [Candidatus Niyogibacteria bacterium]